ncbi:hypothetical protein KM043_017489 [Ampulex compressa]|nr:hypothetical protein KM043_017489 [Ampulex compressa]
MLKSIVLIAAALAVASAAAIDNKEVPTLQEYHGHHGHEHSHHHQHEVHRHNHHDHSSVQFEEQHREPHFYPQGWDEHHHRNHQRYPVQYEEDQQHYTEDAHNHHHHHEDNGIPEWVQDSEFLPIDGEIFEAVAFHNDKSQVANYAKRDGETHPRSERRRYSDDSPVVDEAVKGESYGKRDGETHPRSEHRRYNDDSHVVDQAVKGETYGKRDGETHPRSEHRRYNDDSHVVDQAVKGETYGKRDGETHPRSEHRKYNDDSPVVDQAVKGETYGKRDGETHPRSEHRRYSDDSHVLDHVVKGDNYAKRDAFNQYWLIQCDNSEVFEPRISQYAMQKLLLTILALIALDGYQHLTEGKDWQSLEQPEPISLKTHGGRTKRHFFRGSHRGPFRHGDNNMLDLNIPNANWVCRNPKTGDTMIIMSDDVVPSFPNNWPQFQTQHPGSGHQWQSVLPNNGPYRPHNTYPNNGQTWPNQHIQPSQPNFPPRKEGNQNNCSPSQGQISPNAEDTINTKTTDSPSAFDESSTSNPFHGGEGLIDIRRRKRYARKICTAKRKYYFSCPRGILKGLFCLCMD